MSRHYYIESMPESRGSDKRYKARCKTECNKTQTGEWEHSSSLYSLSVQLSDMIKRRQGSSERKWWRTKQICFCSVNVPMHDAAAIHVRQGVLGEAVRGRGLGTDTEEKERWGGWGVFTGCCDKVRSTKQDEVINRLLLFRLPAHTESLFPCVF